MAGGIGVAPLIFLAENAFNTGHRVTLLIGAQSASSLYPRSLLPARSELVITTEDGSEGRRGIVTDVVDELVEQADQVFACGPVSMYRSMAAKECFARKPVQISLEMMMACGLGACYGCVARTRRGPRQVCHDGPVFELGEIMW
jgi:dihydroorotate dehydrogenase electron transfer subunit